MLGFGPTVFIAEKLEWGTFSRGLARKIKPSMGLNKVPVPC